ncbi:hypothetical protein Tsubulata_016613 [Turnera subulata]|uniref:Peptidase M48 domain-containing protein n=1 Tax=Turnera subulata TaxID=218843 RepID=A0A9Q0FQ44_9ROSI|nr:hypothetical protein Tsubulata_016613 [Turnera subulata]
MSCFRRVKLTFDALRSCSSRIIVPKAPPQASDWTRNSAKYFRIPPHIKFYPNFALPNLPINSFVAYDTRAFSCVSRFLLDPRQPRLIIRKLRVVLIGVVVGSGLCVTVATFVPWVSSNKFFNLYEGNSETIPYSKRKHFVLLTKSMEIDEGEAYIKKFKCKFRDDILPRTHAESIRVRKIANDIIEAMQKDLRPTQDYNRWEILVVNKSLIQAYSHAGGKIIINTGMLRHFSSDTEIAAILAHEVAHVVARHDAEGIKLLGIRISDGNLSKLMSILLLPFYRRREKEADYIGLLLMAAAGYDPRVAPQVYEESEKMGNTGLVYDLLSTHPSGKRELIYYLELMLWKKHWLFTTRIVGSKNKTS